MQEPVGAWFFNLVKAVADTIFPPRCHCCSAFIADGRMVELCDHCLGEMDFISSPICTVCGVPFATAGGIDHRCSGCIGAPPPFSSARAVLLHSGEGRRLVHLFKYERKVELRRPLGLLMAERLPPLPVGGSSLVVPVPLHPKKLRQRGYNQALLLGEVVAQRWRLPLSRHNLQRVRWTEPQTELAAADRVRNVKGAFEIRRPEEIKGKHVLLIDDVYTTGSTAGECSRILIKAGAVMVTVATVARAANH